VLFPLLCRCFLQNSLQRRFSMRRAYPVVPSPRFTSAHQIRFVLRTYNFWTFTRMIASRLLPAVSVSADALTAGPHRLGLCGMCEYTRRSSQRVKVNKWPQSLCRHLPNISPRYVRPHNSFCRSGNSLVCARRVLFLYSVFLYKACGSERMEIVEYRAEGGMDPRCQRQY
jgi:hypothetical protein